MLVHVAQLLAQLHEAQGLLDGGLLQAGVGRLPEARQLWVQRLHTSFEAVAGIVAAAPAQVRQLRHHLLVEDVTAGVDAQHGGAAVRPLGHHALLVGNVELVHGLEDRAGDVLPGEAHLHLDCDQVRSPDPAPGVPVADVELQLGGLPLHALVVVEAEGPQLELLDQQLLHVGGCAEHQGVHRLVPVEGHLLDDLGVGDDLGEDLGQAVEHRPGDVVGSYEVTEHRLSLQSSIFDLPFFTTNFFSILQGFTNRLHLHTFLGLSFLLLNIGSMPHILVVFHQVIGSLITR